MVDTVRLRRVIEQAGDLLLSYRFTPLKRTAKPGAGFVTQADKDVEYFLIEQLSGLFPEATFFSEENGKSARESAYCWVIDPLDGTTNFSYGLPHFCISVALTYNQEPILGVVYQPLLREYFFAQKGAGAFVNDKSIFVSTTHRLSDAFILFCIPYGHNERARRMVSAVVELSQSVVSIRLLGAAALDLAYVAAGRFDGLFFEQLAWWDVAAGSLLIQEAGGAVTDYKGSHLVPTFGSVVAGSATVQAQLRTFLQEYGCV